MGRTRRKSGVLAEEIEPYRQWLAGRGYTPGTMRLMLRELSRLGVWLAARDLPGASIEAAAVAAMFAQRRSQGRPTPGARGVRVLEQFLADRGLLIEQAVDPCPLDVVLCRFRAWLIDERDLAETIVVRYENTARRFLAEQALPGGGLDATGLTGADVNAFLLRECARVSAGSAKGRVAELRSLLRFLHVHGLISSPLAAAVPPVGGWRLAGVPRLVSSREVERVVMAFDINTVEGARNRAMLLLIARLGLRSVVVARLRLDDIDWRHAEITVRGKARREDRLPLPREVGEAIGGYLAVRGACSWSREVSLTCRAPRVPIRADLLGDVVERGCKRAGVERFGPHRMRHALAGTMLRGGADLRAISQVLRHQDLATTAVYAKVDLARLRQVARPWPGAAA